jgi:predicted dehydrogenase
MARIKIGIIGCGNISDIYLQNCTETFRILEVAAVSDIIIDKAKAKAEQYNIPKACTVDELLADPEIQIVLNLTIPGAHAGVSLAALEAGKNVYVEKPLAVTREDGLKVMEKAGQKGLLIGCAPDTFLGGGLQTCRKLIDDSWIGTPVAATAFMTCHGHESWHPDPEFYYKTGGGPMLDMGPYYLTALISLIGPVSSVAGSSRITFPQRTITSTPKSGKTIDVEVPTHVAGIINFCSGATGTIITSFDIWGSKLPRIEIYGSEGTLSVPDPNTFGGPVLIQRQGQTGWTEIPLTHGYSANSRGIGVADMACALLSGEKHRANGRMAYHVLDIMLGFNDSSENGVLYKAASSCEKPSAIPMGLQKPFFPIS